MNFDPEAKQLFEKFGESWPSRQDIPDIKHALLKKRFKTVEVMLKRYFTKTSDFSQLVQSINVDFTYHGDRCRLYLGAASVNSGVIVLIAFDPYKSTVLYRFCLEL